MCHSRWAHAVGAALALKRQRSSRTRIGRHLRLRKPGTACHQAFVWRLRFQPVGGHAGSAVQGCGAEAAKFAAGGSACAVLALPPDTWRGELETGAAQMLAAPVVRAQPAIRWNRS